MRLFDQQPGKAGTINEEIGGQPHQAQAFSVKPQILDIKCRIEMIGGDDGQEVARVLRGARTEYQPNTAITVQSEQSDNSPPSPI